MELEELIAESFGSAAAQTWAALTLSQEQSEALARAGQKILEGYPSKPGACAMMSAVYALYLQKLNAPSGYVVAGSLYVGETRVFGEDGDIDGANRFSKSDSAWDGHAWIVSGDWIADASIFRTAYSTGSPPALAQHVLQNFGKGRGLLVCKRASAEELGFRYVPQYVLTQKQIDVLGASARAMLTGKQRG